MSDGFTRQSKNTLFTEIIRNNEATIEPDSCEFKRRTLHAIGRNNDSDAAANYLIRVAASDRDMELRKSAVASLGRIAGQKKFRCSDRHR